MRSGQDHGPYKTYYPVLLKFPSIYLTDYSGIRYKAIPLGAQMLIKKGILKAHSGF